MRKRVLTWPSLLALAAAFLVAGCGASLPGLKHGGGSLSLTVNGAPDCNNCQSHTASALAVRIFQVSDSTAIKGVLNNKALSWGKQVDAAAANVLGKPIEDYVRPGGSKSLVVARDAKATAVVVEGNFCVKSGSDWYFILPGKARQAALVAGPTRFTLTTEK
jgi:predicted component of type VI protein secretion system